MTDPSAEERFRGLYSRHHPAITAYFVRRIGSQDTADATDDVFAVAWRRLVEVPHIDEALPWLYGVARNVLANRRRGARRHDRLLGRIWSQGRQVLAGPEPQVIRNLQSQEVVEALATLRRDDQELLLLAYWEGLTHVRIGQLLGCSKSAVDARVHRALNRMRQAMRQTGHKPKAKANGASTIKEQA